MRYQGSVGAVSYQRESAETKPTDLEGRQRNCRQRNCIIVKSFGSADSALELNMCAKIVRCELYIAVIDKIYDSFGKVDDALG